MNYKQTFDIFSFPWWAGAKERIDSLTYNQRKKFEIYIEDAFQDCTPTLTEINDFVWFDCDEYLEQLVNIDDEDYLTEHWFFN